MYDELVALLRKKYDQAPMVMEAADAIEELDTLLDGLKADNDALCETIERLQKPRWIPVTERLPEEKYAVLVWVPKYRNHYVCFISDGEWYLFGGHNVIVVGVTRWMPLPEPPEEET